MIRIWLDEMRVTKRMGARVRVRARMSVRVRVRVRVKVRVRAILRIKAPAVYPNPRDVPLNHTNSVGGTAQRMP